MLDPPEGQQATGPANRHASSRYKAQQILTPPHGEVRAPQETFPSYCLGNPAPHCLSSIPKLPRVGARNYIFTCLAPHLLIHQLCTEQLSVILGTKRTAKSCKRRMLLRGGGSMNSRETSVRSFQSLPGQCLIRASRKGFPPLEEECKGVRITKGWALRAIFCALQ